MADNIGIIVPDPGSQNKAVRARSLGGSPEVEVQKVDVAAWLPTLVAGHQYNVDILDTAVTTLTKPSGATHVLCSIKGAAVKMREDDTDPTATAGIDLPDGFIGELPIPGASLRFLGILGDAKGNFSYRRYI